MITWVCQLNQHQAYWDEVENKVFDIESFKFVDIHLDDNIHNKQLFEVLA